MFVTGAQIRAARALAGMLQTDLAAASNIHAQALRYWERRAAIPRREPYAVRQIRKALEQRGIKVFTDPAPGVCFSPPVPRPDSL